MTDILELIEQDGDDLEEIADGELLVLEDDGSELEDSSELSEAKARELTSAIRAAAEATCILIARAHEGKAYKALGYATWADYVSKEFEFSPQRSYQYLFQFKAIKEIEAAAPEGTIVKLTEAQARDIKRELPFITSRIAEETEGMEVDEAADRIEEIVQEARDQKKADDAAIALKEKNLAEAEEEGYRAGLEAGADAILASDGFDLSDGEDEDEDTGWGDDGGDSSNDGPGLSPQVAMDLHNFVNVLANQGALPDPQELVDAVPDSKFADIKAQAVRAEEWFHKFNELAEERD